MYWLFIGSRFRCKIDRGDVFSSASETLFLVMYFYMTMFFFLLLFYQIVAIVIIQKALCYCQFIAIKYIQCIFMFSLQP